SSHILPQPATGLIKTWRCGLWGITPLVFRGKLPRVTGFPLRRFLRPRAGLSRMACKPTGRRVGAACHAGGAPNVARISEPLTLEWILQYQPEAQATEPRGTSAGKLCLAPWRLCVRFLRSLRDRRCVGI